MSEDYLVQQPTMAWNTQMKWWNTSQVDLFSQLSLPFLGTWQTSGMMRNGQVFELPMQERHTTDSEFSSSPILPTTRAQHGEDRNNKIYARDPKQPQNLENALAVTLMPTPNTMDHLPARTAEQKAANKGKGGYANVRETVVNDLMPTPMSRDYKGDTSPHERNGVIQTDTVKRAIFHSGEVLLPTTRTSMKNGASAKELADGNPKFRLEAVTNWGKFEPAIKRWEETIGRPAPAPTKPDGKDGAHRLSSAFTEWMMGLPAGWITDVGLTRNEELKACGNGVVPQQAELALRFLLEGVELNG